MAPPHRLSRRSLLLGVLGATLAACGPGGRESRRGPGTPMPATAAVLTRPTAAVAPSGLSLQQLGLTDAVPGPPAATGFQPPPPPAPVVMVWQTDGGTDRLALPTGLAVDRQGVLTVVDAGNDRLVQLATGAGEATARLGGPGDAPGQFRFGSIGDADRGKFRAVGGGVAVDLAGSLYVADSFNGRVQRLDRAGRVVATWGDAPPTVGPIVEPAGIAVDDRQGRVYVADASAHRVHAFDRDGRWLLAWGGPGQGAGEFVRPAAVAVDRHGLVYVADHLNDRIQVFDDGGRFVTMWGGPGPQPGDFSRPNGVAVDGVGHVYVATTSRILVFSATGVFLAAWDGPGGGADAFGALGGVAVDEQGAIYVADQIPARVLKFRPRGPWPLAAGTPTPRPTRPPATPGLPATATPMAFMTPTDR
jgi:DNA-binding beta-propeller fold protein YncE